MSLQNALIQYPEFILEVLRSRGIQEPQQIQDFLNPKLSQLKDPFLMKGMTEAVQRLSEAFLRQEKICIYADFDLDGTSGLALLLKGFKSLGFENVIGFQPLRLKQGYGFHVETVEELAQQGVQVIVTVDVGITAVPAAQRAKELGLDVIITDHHQPGDILPDALVVMNPNLKSCTSGLGYLSGAGVAFYLLRGLRRGLDPVLSESAKGWDIKTVLEFFTIATITDMVPLVEDNRILVKYGLHQFIKTEHAGLKALMKELELEGRILTTADIGMKLAPKLNALSRMDSELKPIDILMCESEEKADSLVHQVLGQNKLRVELQLSAQNEADQYLRENPPEQFVFVVSENFHRGVVGLLAQKLSQTYGVPAFVGSLEKASGQVVGSGRAPSGWSLLPALSSAQEFLDRFGGHPAAAGFEFAESKIKNIQQSLQLFFANLKNSTTEKNSVEAEGATVSSWPLDLSQINTHFMRWYEFLGPYGVGFETPQIRLQNVLVAKVQVLKDAHLKLQLCSEESSNLPLSAHSVGAGDSKVEAILFSASSTAKELLTVGRKVSLLVEPQWNYFAGRKNLQLLVKDFTGVS